jgi:hypothetical protein
LLERVETLASALQEFLIRQTALDPFSTGHAGTLRLNLPFRPGVHHLGNSQNSLVRDAETLDQGSNVQSFSVVGKFHFKHIVGNGVAVFCRRCRNEPGLGSMVCE